jgi:DNA invertase Pin-like site-specific DNA recombinase
MKFGYARVSSDGQSVDAQVCQLTKAGCKKVFREVASGARTDRAQFCRLLDQLEAGDVLTVTRLDRLARSTRDLLNTLAAIADWKAGFRSLGDAWADTTTAHGRLMLTVLGGLAEFERDLIRAHQRRMRARKGARRQARSQTEADRRDIDGEPVREIARSYNVSHSTDFTAHVVKTVEKRTMAVVLPVLRKFRAEGKIIGRLVVGYGELEIDLCRCIAAAGTNLDHVVRAMFKTQGENGE